jgi:hypothetical protein
LLIRFGVGLSLSQEYHQQMVDRLKGCKLVSSRIGLRTNVFKRFASIEPNDIVFTLRTSYPETFNYYLNC